MNWGNKLMVVFLLFAALMATLVYKASNTRYELVSKDYYKDELKFQEKIDGTNKANLLSNIELKQDSGFLSLVLPAEMWGQPITGEALFYCNTDETKDRRILLAVNERGEQKIPLDQLSKTNYRLKLSWQSASNKYYTEKNISIK
ncbi:MAG: hypothetical protein RLZZ28_2718 [Bacteroidota bacterium]|jgi:hypothetical protein